MHGSSAGRLTPPGKHTGASRAPEHTARDAADARARHVLEPVRRTLDNGLCRAQSAADRRSNALTQIAGREPRGVPGDEGVVAAYHVHAPAQVVAVAARIVVGARREPAPERRGQMRPVLPDVVPAALHALGDPADAYIEPALLLGHVPGVTGQPVVEEPQVAVAVLPVVLDLVLERDDLQLGGARVQLAEQRAVHRAARAARADQPAAAKRVVYDKAVAVARDAPHVVLLERRARALQQPGVEFEAADGMLHARHRNVQPSEVHPQARESQQAVRIGPQVHIQIAHHLGRDPAGAQLQAREALAIEHQDVGAGVPQLPGGGRARGPPADDEDVT